MISAKPSKSPMFRSRFYPKLDHRSTVFKPWTTCEVNRRLGEYCTELYVSQTGRAHLLLLSKTPGGAGGAIGVITLEGGHSPIPYSRLTDVCCFAPDIIEVGRIVHGGLCSIDLGFRKLSPRKSLTRQTDMRTTDTRNARRGERLLQ